MRGRALRDRLDIIDNTKEARDDYGHLWGSSITTISREYAEALLAGEVLAVNVNDEYVVFIVVEDD